MEGPFDGDYIVHRATPAGTTLPGTQTQIKEFTIPKGAWLPFFYDAHADFEVQYYVRASERVNVYVLNEANYHKFITKAAFSFEAGPTLLDLENATLSHYVIAVSEPTRYYVVVEQAYDTNRPLYRVQTGADDGSRWPDSQVFVCVCCRE